MIKNVLLLLQWINAFFSFLFADDMNVYEGRGWFVEPSIVEKRYQSKRGQMFEIAYIGKLEGKCIYLNPGNLYAN